MSENDKLVKVTVSFYYKPDLSDGGGYSEYNGYGQYIKHCTTSEQAAAYDLHNYLEGQFGIEEYIDFGHDDREIVVQVVRRVPDQFLEDIVNEEVLYTVPQDFEEDDNA